MDTKHPRYLHMFLVFIKIGLFTIGGGPAMIPLIRFDIAVIVLLAGCAGFFM